MGARVKASVSAYTEGVRYCADLTKVRGVSRCEVVFAVNNLYSLRELGGYIYLFKSPDLPTVVANVRYMTPC